MFFPKLVHSFVAVHASCLVADGDGDVVLLSNGGDSGDDIVDLVVLALSTPACLLEWLGCKRDRHDNCCCFFFA